MENYNLLLKSLSDNAKIVNKQGLSIQMRNCLDREEGKVDPRHTEAVLLTKDDFKFNRENIHPELLANEIHLLGVDNYKYELDRLRQSFSWTSTDKSKNIVTSYIYHIQTEKLDFINMNQKQKIKTDHV